jgi:hypothetical protein
MSIVDCSELLAALSEGIIVRLKQVEVLENHGMLLFLLISGGDGA